MGNDSMQINERNQSNVSSEDRPLANMHTLEWEDTIKILVETMWAPDGIAGAL
jgi:hypothetical protein